MGLTTGSRFAQCNSTKERKQCTNFALLEPGDAWATQIGTGASCYSRTDGDGTPYRLECRFPEKPVLYPPPPPSPSPPPPAPLSPGAYAATDENGSDVVAKGGMSGGGVLALVLVFGVFFAIGGYWVGRPEKAKAFASMVRDLASAAWGQAKAIKTRAQTGSTSTTSGAAMASSDYLHRQRASQHRAVGMLSTAPAPAGATCRGEPACRPFGPTDATDPIPCSTCRPRHAHRAPRPLRLPARPGCTGAAAGVGRRVRGARAYRGARGGI